MPYFIGFAEKCGANGGSLRPLFLFLQVKSVKASALDLRADHFYSYQSLNGRLRTPEPSSARSRPFICTESRARVFFASKKSSSLILDTAHFRQYSPSTASNSRAHLNGSLRAHALFDYTAEKHSLRLCEAVAGKRLTI